MTTRAEYATVTAAYWAFTLTDGALRMLVLLHFHLIGFSPLELAALFLLYEAMGVFSNFLGGWIGARFGLRSTLFSGLSIQIIALLLLSQTDPDWVLALSVPYVMLSQALSGIAKDLTKMSSKSAVKLLVSDDSDNRLFRWVAALTGSKNALKGAGFFLGGALLSGLGFEAGLLAMAGGLTLVLLFCFGRVQAGLGKSRKAIRGRDILSKDRSINLLSFARFFLFSARDVWFVIALPLFLKDALNWDFYEVGAFMALWTIAYGMVQGFTPKLLGRTQKQAAGQDRSDTSNALALARRWLIVLLLIPGAIALALNLLEMQGWSVNPSIILIGGLFLFGFVFALNSSLHSYLIVGLSKTEQVTLNVGFYYSANAAGRFLGTLLSGLLYMYADLNGALWASTALLAMALFFTIRLQPK